MMWAPGFVSEFAEVETEMPLLPKADQIRVVVHDVVQDVYVVGSLCINAAAGLRVDRIVLDRNVVGQWDTAGRIDTYAVPVEARVSGAVPSQRRLQVKLAAPPTTVKPSTTM